MRQKKSEMLVTCERSFPSISHRGNTLQPGVVLERRVLARARQNERGIRNELRGATRRQRPGDGLVLTLSLGASIGEAKIVNGDFSNPKVRAGATEQFPGNGVPGWKTTDSHIEIWSSGMKHGQVVFRAPAGYTQVAEINANTDGTLSQVVTDIKVNNKYGFSFYHRGRESATVADVIQVRAVDVVTKAVLPDRNFATTNVDWQRYTVELGVKRDNNALELSFKTVSSAAGTDLSIGNLLAGVELGESFMAPPTADGADVALFPRRCAY